GAGPLIIVQDPEWNIMLLHVFPNPSRSLVYGDVDTEILDLVPGQLLGLLKAGEQCFAVLAPGSPELEDHRLLSDPLPQVDRLAVEVVDRKDRSGTTHLDAGITLGSSETGC